MHVAFFLGSVVGRHLTNMRVSPPKECAFRDSKQCSSHWQGQNGSPFYWVLTSQSPLSSASLHLPLRAPSQGCLVCALIKGNKHPPGGQIQTYPLRGMAPRGSVEGKGIVLQIQQGTSFKLKQKSRVTLSPRPPFAQFSKISNRL